MLQDYPSDCFPESWYIRFPFLEGDDEEPFWQGWADLRLKTFQLIENKYFETAVITMILLSSFALVIFWIYIKAY
jgi:voltage-gated sodium channel type II alpha